MTAAPDARKALSEMRGWLMTATVIASILSGMGVFAFRVGLTVQHNSDLVMRLSHHMCLIEVVLHQTDMQECLADFGVRTSDPPRPLGGDPP